MSKDAIEYVRDRANEYGDDVALSEADMSLLAKAFETNGVLVSDDFDLQNMCLKMGIKFMPVLRSVRERRDWVYRCPGCKRKIVIKNNERVCPICGTPLTTKRL